MHLDRKRHACEMRDKTAIIPAGECREAEGEAEAELLNNLL